MGVDARMYFLTKDQKVKANKIGQDWTPVEGK